MASNSFKDEFKAPLLPRPSTPERPVAAIELIPEAAIAIAEILKRGPTHRRPTLRNPTQKTRNGARNTKPSSSRAPRHSHSHSATFAVPPASPIDTLASVAAFEATARRSPPTFHNLYQSQYPFERAAKRARSEIAASPQQPVTSPLFDFSGTTRPATFYNYNGWGHIVDYGVNQQQRVRAYSTHTRNGSTNGAYQESNVDEAELLLNFSRGGGTSSSHGLGISTSTGADTQSASRVPALPPFPFTAAQQTPRALAESVVVQSPPMTSPTRPAPPHSPISPPANLSRAVAITKSVLLPLQEPHTETPPQHLVDGADHMELDSNETKSEDVDMTIADAPEHSKDETKDEESHTNSRSNTVPEQIAKLPASLHVPDLDGRRYSDSHHDNPLKRVRLEESRRSSSVPLDYAASETTEPSTTMDSQHNGDDPAKVPEQGVICPACNNTADVASEKVEWLQCDGCDQWYHVTCSGLTPKQSKVIDKYYCKSCEPKHGKSTKKRTSTRVRNTVDYAGLNEGVLRMPGESREHHYIEAFKSNDINLTPETFPRMPASQITSEYFEKSYSFSEPVLIPGHLNPRPKFPGTTPKEELLEDDDRILVKDHGQDDMDMVIPQELTVRRVAQHYGPKNIIPVIDVKAQESSKGWTVEKWADYYESPAEQPIRNVISLECSQTPLWRLIRRPKVVRDIDLQDSVWPDNEMRRSVAFYVLMSVADSYTDFHIDFGGSSVYYHILKGKKVFFFIPPTPSNLQKYQDWNDMPSQTWTWLPDITKTKECYRVDLYPGDTMLIPAGWIHAVWTPDDSLVIGGNFLTRLHYGMQFRVADIEKANKTPPAFRYPKFQKVMWYAVLQYLEQDPLPDGVRNAFLDGQQFTRATPVWSQFDKFGENSELGRENYNAKYYSKAELDGLPEMVSFIFRTVMIQMDRVENITAKARKAVMDSIPKLDKNRTPLDVARDFAMWVAWKRGNEDIPEWAHPGAVLPEKADEAAGDDRKMTEAQMKKFQKASAISLPERHSARLKTVAESAVSIMQPNTNVDSNIVTASTPKTSSLGPRRTACDSCRRRKMRCKHVENLPSHSSPIVFTNPIETSPQSNFMGVVIPNGQTPPVHPPPAAYQPPPFQVEQLTPMANGYAEIQAYGTGGPKQEMVDLKKGRTKACYECRRSKRRCIHDEYGKVDPVKQKEPVVPRGAVKRKSGPGPEMPIAKKPQLNDQVAPVAPMMAGQMNSFGSPTPPVHVVPVVQTKQDGMFRNSTVNDFSAMIGVVNLDPLASRALQPRHSSASTNGYQHSQSHSQQHSQSPSVASPARPQPPDWALDPALMDPSLGAPSERHQSEEDADYNAAQNAILGYYSSTVHAPPPSSQEAANNFMNGFVDYDAGQRPPSQHNTKVERDPDIDPMLQDAVAKLNDHPVTNGAGSCNDASFDPALDQAYHHLPNGDQSNGVVVPSTEASSANAAPPYEADAGRQIAQEVAFASPAVKKQRPQTPELGGSAVKSVSPLAYRTTSGKTPTSNSKRKESSVSLEDADPETRRLIEQMRREDLQTRGLRRRS